MAGLLGTGVVIALAIGVVIGRDSDGRPQGARSGIQGITVVTGCKLDIRHCFSYRRKGLTQRIVRVSDGTEVGTFHSDERGRFRVELAPGVYLIQQAGSSGGAGRLRPSRVKVEMSRFTSVKLRYIAPLD